MEYPSYTNESDAQFSAQIDRYKLGPGVAPGTSAFWASEAAMDSMGNSNENVMKLMQARASLHQTSMGTRKAISEDQKAQKDWDELDEFSSSVREGWGDDPVENARLLEKGVAMHPTNAIIANSATNLGNISGNKFKAQRDVYAGRDADFMEAQRAEREEIATLNSRIALQGLQSQERGLKKAFEQDVNSGIEAIGKVSGLLMESESEEDRAAASSLTEGLTRLRMSGNMEDVADFAGIGMSFYKTSRYDAVNAPELNKVAERKKQIFDRHEIDIDAAQTPEERAKALELITLATERDKPTNTPDKEVNIRNRRWLRETEELLGKDAEFLEIRNQRSAIGQAIASLGTTVPGKDATYDEKLAWAIKNDKLRANMAGVNMKIDKKLEERQLYFEERDRKMEFDKKWLGNQKMMQDMKLNAQDPYFKQMAHDLAAQRLSQADQIATFREAIKLKKDRAFSHKSDEELWLFIESARQRARDVSGGSGGGIDLGPAE